MGGGADDSWEVVQVTGGGGGAGDRWVVRGLKSRTGDYIADSQY